MKKFFIIILYLCFPKLVEAQTINFVDPNFKSAVLYSLALNLSGQFFNVDSNQDGEIQVSEASQVSYIDVSNQQINSMIGIQYFINLKRLDCHGNYITSLDVNDLVHLEYLDCTGNSMQVLNLGNVPGLKNLFCGNNSLQDLDFSGASNLNSIDCRGNLIATMDLSNVSLLGALQCSGNQLYSLDLSNVSNLYYLECNYNHLTALTLDNLTYLNELYCSHNQITSLNLDGLAYLTEVKCNDNALTSISLNNASQIYTLNCFNNQLTTIDANDLVNLQTLNAYNNQLTSLYIKNHHVESNIRIQENPFLIYICADDEQITTVHDLAMQYGYVNCVVDSACLLANESFTQINTIAIHPNPASDFFHVDFKVGEIMPMIEVYTALGQLVLKFENVTNESNLDISRLSKGNYYMKLNSTDASQSFKLIKM